METDEHERKIKQIMEEVEKEMPKLPYHNFQHALDVYLNSENIAILSGVEYEGRQLLQTAALLHDIIVIPGAKDNEERSANFATGYLSTLGYEGKQIEIVEGLILATKMPQKPDGLLQKIICDADLDNLGRADFIELGEGVREELGIPPGKEWYKSLESFLENHKYHTLIQRILRNEGKMRNLDRLKGMLIRYAA